MDVLFFLLISSMMISSGKGYSSTVETKQCSVFPGRPKCFEPIKQIKGTEQEITSFISVETVTTINRGESVAISGVKISGVRDDTTVGERSSRVWCYKDTNYDDTIHGTQFWKSNGTDWKNVTDLDAKDLVITTRREKWTCIQGIRETSTELCRMVTEHLTKKIIGRVNYPVGTYIHKIPIPRLRHDEQQMYRAAIREIKYTDTSFVKKKYEGSLEEKRDEVSTEIAEENTGDFIELDKAGDVVTVSNSSGPNSSGKIVYKRKSSIQTGEAFKNQESSAKCYKVDMDHIRTNDVFGIFPEWSYSVNDGRTYTSIETSNFHEKFIITKYQIMRCGIEHQADLTFFRVDMEYLFTGDVNEVHVTETIDNIYKFKLPGSSTETSFGIVESFDFNLETPTDAFRFAGKVTIDESSTLRHDEYLKMILVPVKTQEKTSKQGKKLEPSKSSKGWCCIGRSKTAP
ncbi:uncharacterized protein LOC111051414 [Nilaparvata lugens]|uniref:uncharacterized protein LOC111051414 n=2 Tax=Nilaparvata lugens TaxID=108931 RepID=UPI00193E9E28|nr:uncharacterized protein LOC111051414 [Nilaparvata lugens]